jgi:hypothetical protein
MGIGDEIKMRNDIVGGGFLRRIPKRDCVTFSDFRVQFAVAVPMWQGQSLVILGRRMMFGVGFEGCTIFATSKFAGTATTS